MPASATSTLSCLVLSCLENVNSESSFVLSIYHILFAEDNRILQCALDALQNWSEKWLLNVNVENV